MSMVCLLPCFCGLSVAAGTTVCGSGTTTSGSSRARPSSTDRDLPPRDRLLAIFDLPPGTTGVIPRGCPFANAAVEIAALDHPVHHLAAEH
jgi:hypothetical protein